VKGYTVGEGSRRKERVVYNKTGVSCALVVGLELPDKSCSTLAEGFHSPCASVSWLFRFPMIPLYLMHGPLKKILALGNLKIFYTW
jgi:hypothetical protein